MSSSPQPSNDSRHVLFEISFPLFCSLIFLSVPWRLCAGSCSIKACRLPLLNCIVSFPPGLMIRGKRVFVRQITSVRRDGWDPCLKGVWVCACVRALGVWIPKQSTKYLLSLWTSSVIRSERGMCWCCCGSKCFTCVVFVKSMICRRYLRFTGLRADKRHKRPAWVMQTSDFSHPGRNISDIHAHTHTNQSFQYTADCAIN